jgi:hypothetical protein
VCVDTQSGDTLWALLGTSAFLAEAKVSPDDSRVFNLQSADGRVYCNDQISGDTLWVADCDLFVEDCSSTVQAEFTLSNNGQYLYYGDVAGWMIALKLGDMIEAVVPAPTPALAPVAVPVFTPQEPGSPEWPTVAETQQETSNVKRGLTLGGSIALILVAVIIGIGASVYIFAVNHFKTYPHPQQEPHLPVDAIVDHDIHYLQPHDHPEQHPDPYEDAMISKIQSTRQEYPQDYDPGTALSEDPYRKQYSEDFDNYSHAPADRISQRLGTSNKIMPITAQGTLGAEDYSYGASLLL